MLLFVIFSYGLKSIIKSIFINFIFNFFSFFYSINFDWFIYNWFMVEHFWWSWFHFKTINNELSTFRRYYRSIDACLIIFRLKGLFLNVVQSMKQEIIEICFKKNGLILLTRWKFYFIILNPFFKMIFAQKLFLLIFFMDENKSTHWIKV